MPDYTNIFRIQATPNPAGWTVAKGGVVDLQVVILQGPCTSLELVLSPTSLRFDENNSFALNKTISPPVASGGIITVKLRAPAVAGVTTVRMGGIVRTRDAGWPVGGGSVPRDANAGPWTLTATETEPPQPPQPPDPPEPPPGTAGGLRLTWFQARFLARLALKIRRDGWKDRYLEYVDGLWYLQLINPLTGVATTRAVVQGVDWAAEHFRANDWTCDAVDAAALAAAREIRTVFP